MISLDCLRKLAEDDRVGLLVVLPDPNNEGCPKPAWYLTLSRQSVGIASMST